MSDTALVHLLIIVLFTVIAYVITLKVTADTTFAFLVGVVVLVLLVVGIGA